MKYLNLYKKLGLRNEQEVFDKLSKKGVFVMMSNSNTEFIRKLYAQYNIHFVSANRMINSDANKRGKIRELVVTNY